MNQELTEAIKELTLNMESETVVELSQQLEPILWWHFVGLPLIESVFITIVVVMLMFGFYKVMTYEE